MQINITVAVHALFLRQICKFCLLEAEITLCAWPLLPTDPRTRNMTCKPTALTSHVHLLLLHAYMTMERSFWFILFSTAVIATWIHLYTCTSSLSVHALAFHQQMAYFSGMSPSDLIIGWCLSLLNFSFLMLTAIPLSRDGSLLKTFDFQDLSHTNLFFEGIVQAII